MFLGAPCMPFHLLSSYFLSVFPNAIAEEEQVFLFSLLGLPLVWPHVQFC